MATISGDSTNNILSGTSGSDVISGGGGDDVILAGSGSDRVAGGSGDDTLSGGNGNDLLLGGSGDDIIEGGNGNDLLFGGSGDDALSGGNGNDLLLGGSGDDLLLGDSGNDILEGGSGNDTLDGGSGQDVLFGGSGNDILIGVGGADWMQGGAGNDVFSYQDASDSNSSGWDRIIDFTQGKDKIDLSDLLGPTTNLAWGDRTAAANAVWYQNSGSSTFVFADINNDGKADLKIELKNTYGLKLTSSDFLGVGMAPVASDGAAQGDEDTVVTGTLTGVTGARLATNPGGGTLNFSVVGGPANGTLVLQTDGSFHYTPNANFNGSDVFTYKVNDGSFESNVATVTLTVNSVNDAPEAQAQSGATNEDTAFNGTLVATDVDNANLTYSIVAPVDGVTVNPDGTFSVTPLAADQGLDDGESREVTFQYVANDGTADSAPATVTITINGANDAPVAENMNGATNEDTAYYGSLAATDIDVENLSYSIVAPVDGVTVHENGTYSFDPRGLYDFLAEDAITTVSFQYVANDGTVDSAPATVTISLTGVNDAPVAVADEAVADAGGSASGNVLTSALGRDFDPDAGDSLKVTALDGVEPGDLVFGEFGYVIMDGDGFGNWTYTLTANVADGPSVDDAFNYTIEDAHGATSSSTLTVHVTGTGGSSASFTSSAAAVTVTATPDTNTAPVAVADEANAGRAGTSGNVLGNDMDLDTGDSLIVTGVNGNFVDGDAFAYGSYGSLFMTDVGAWSYSLNSAGTDALAQGASVDDVFGYTMADTDGATASSTLTIHIADFIL